MIGVATPPCVSTPSVSGVTSSSSTSWTSPAWIAAPAATTSSGFTPLCGSLPKICSTLRWIAGIRVMPPTSTTSSISLAQSPASSSAILHGSERRSIRSPVSSSSSRRVIDSARCLGPALSAAMNGRLMSVSSQDDSSCFARSAASLIRCSAIASLRTSMPLCSLNTSIM